MNHRIRLLMSWLVAAWFALPLLAHAGRSAHVSGIPSGAGISVTAESWLESIPGRGYLPVRITVNNRRASDGVWLVQFRARSSHFMGRTVASSTSLACPAGRSVTHEILIPLPANEQYTEPNVAAEISGPGIPARAQAIFSGSGSYGSRTEFIAMSDTLAVGAWGPLEAAVSGRAGPRSSGSSSGSLNLRGCKLELADAPQDWRAYSGIDTFFLSAADWRSFPQAARPALLDWVASGGRLRIVGSGIAPGDIAPGSLPSPNGGTERLYGFGLVNVQAEDQGKFPVDAVASELRARASVSGGSYDSSWALVDEIGAVRMNLPLLVIFMLGFALLVGPVNLFLFAGHGRRHRLFWTTPLISAAASILLAVLIIVQDGFGGHGTRQVLVSLLPESKRAVIVQEQLSRTGVLVAQSFAATEPAVFAAVYHPVGGESRARLYREDGSERSGDWFASRAVQGHLLTAVRPARAGIELLPADPSGKPSIVSSVGAVLDVVFVRDETNGVWTAATVRPGERQPLTPSSAADLETWCKTHTARLGPAAQARAARITRVAPMEFYAVTRHPGELVLPSLPAIRWNHDTAICHGPVTRRNP